MNFNNEMILGVHNKSTENQNWAYYDNLILPPKWRFESTTNTTWWSVKDTT